MLPSPAALFVGIDVSCAKSKRLPLVVARADGGRLVPIDRRELPGNWPRGVGNRRLAEGGYPLADDAGARSFAEETLRFLESVETTHGPVRRIAVDAPRQPPLRGAKRLSETALDDEEIWYIRTPSDFDLVCDRAREAIARGVRESHLPEANRLWMVAGFALFDVLGRAYGEDRLLEVYPYAAFHRLGAARHRKSTRQGQQDRLGALAAHTGWAGAGDLRTRLRSATWGPLDDKIDAFVAAAIAWRFPEVDGLPACSRPASADCIWVPRP